MRPLKQGNHGFSHKLLRKFLPSKVLLMDKIWRISLKQREATRTLIAEKYSIDFYRVGFNPKFFAAVDGSFISFGWDQCCPALVALVALPCL